MKKCSIIFRQAWNMAFYLISEKGYSPRLAVQESAERYVLTDEEYYNLHRDFLSYPNQAIKSYR